MPIPCSSIPSWDHWDGFQGAAAAPGGGTHPLPQNSSHKSLSRAPMAHPGLLQFPPSQAGQDWVPADTFSPTTALNYRR